MSKCNRCGRESKDEWQFCPFCGARRNGDMADAFGRDLFSQIFATVKDDDIFKDFDNAFRDIKAEKIDLTPWFDEMRRSSSPNVQKKGFSVKITSGTGMKPRVNVVTFGGISPNDIGKEIGKGISSQNEIERSVMSTGPKFSSTNVKVTEEPKTEIKRLGDKVVVDIHLPGVKGEDNIDVKELESSIEVRAVAGDKAYFKILTKPPQFGLSAKSFKGEMLNLVFS